MADEEIQLDVLPSPENFYRDIRQAKERGATWIAKALMQIFGGAILAALVGGFTILGVHPPPSAGPGAKENIIGEAVLPLLQGVGTFAITVFRPLLAFILGYYFGEKKQDGTA
jgi:hypothetical protein